MQSLLCCQLTHPTVNQGVQVKSCLVFFISVAVSKVNDTIANHLVKRSLHLLIHYWRLNQSLPLCRPFLNFL